MGRKEKYRVFRPRRRAILRRSRALLSPGTWVFGFAGIAFGVVVNANWPPAPSIVALAAPPPAAEVAIAETPKTVEAFRPVTVAASPAPEADSPPPTDQPALHAGAVARVVDGDTFYLVGVKTRIRLWGVDAPEAGESGGSEATEALATLVAGRELACEELDRDRFARIVARCLLDDGRDVGRILIETGAATEMLRFSGGYYGG